MAALRATQSDVARQAGVSRRLVSAVLHSNAPNIRVSAETRERVERAAAELGYRPNVVARSLVTGKTHTLGLVIHSLSNPFFAELAEALYAAARARGYDLLIALAEGRHDLQLHQMEYLIQRRVDGLLVWMGRSTSRYPCLAPDVGRRVPYVALGRCIPEGGTDCIGVDRAAGMEQAVAHLVQLGITAIGYLGNDVVADPPPESTSKFAGFLAALRRRDLAPAACIYQSWRQFIPDESDVAGYEVGRELAAGSTRPRALLCEGDRVALGLIAGLEDGGLHVPQDVAVIGYDGIAEGRLSRPPLTTVAQPSEQLVELGLAALLRQIEDPDAPAEPITLEPRLIVRQSCGAVSMTNNHRRIKEERL
jgi:LacI family transcriptional regulator, galactose operon repressor